MSSHNHDTWAAEEAQARAIVNAMGAGWSLEDGSGSPDEWHSWQARRLRDDLRIGFEWPDYPRSAHGRISVRLIWPCDAKRQPRVIRTPYGQPEPTTSISMAASKDAGALAKGILTRLVLKDGERLHAEAQRLIQAADVAQQGQARTVAAILAAEAGSRLSPNSGDSVIYLGERSHGYTVRVDSDTSVRFEPFSVDLPTALRILAALRKPDIAHQIRAKEQR